LLFDLHPKENREELFGRDEEIEYSVKQLISGNWLIIGGQREIGKTSLMKVVINELKKKGFKGIYLNLKGVRSLNSLLTLIVSEINRMKMQLTFKVSINFIIGSAGIEIKKGTKVMNGLIELFNSIRDDFIVGLDEVQEISLASKQFLDVLGNIFASNPKVRFIFTGSYIGVMKILMNPPSSSSLHGRPPVVLKLRPFNENLSKEFLRRGMEELNVSFNKEDEVVRKLNGIVGWLTLFGNFYAVRRMSFDDALTSVINEGKKIMIDEFKHFLEGKSNKELYLTLMDVLKIANLWRDIKRGVEIKLGKIDDKELALALESLNNNNFIEKKRKGEYIIVDPILREIDYGKMKYER
jgi:AAA+ ATPase superfamily predicted ATPase